MYNLRFQSYIFSSTSTNINYILTHCMLLFVKYILDKMFVELLVQYLYKICSSILILRRFLFLITS